MSRTINFQTVSWFWDLYNRKLLELDPPYQRRSVWNQDYKDFFVDTVLNGYPAPAIFIYQEITPEAEMLNADTKLYIDGYTNSKKPK